MDTLDRIKDVVLDRNLSCPECDFEPDSKPSEVFIRRKDDVSKQNCFPGWTCPECSYKFQAIICECGLGYTCVRDFDVVEIKNPIRKYKCTGCGEELHRIRKR